MNCVEPIRTYDYLVAARGRVFDWIRPLGAEACLREFSIGLGTIGKTLTHVMISEWYYVRRICGDEIPPYETWPIRQEEPPAFGAIEAAWVEQAVETRAALSGVRDWGEKVGYSSKGYDGVACVMTPSVGDLLTQLVLHEVHHRAQVMGMLRACGIAAQDVDFNALMFESRRV